MGSVVRRVANSCGGAAGERFPGSVLEPVAFLEDARELTMSSPIDELDVAIIGMAGRFPGARNIDELWRNLRDGAEAIRTLTREDLDRARANGDRVDDASYVPAASTLEDIQ